MYLTSKTFRKLELKQYEILFLLVENVIVHFHFGISLEIVWH